MNKYLASWLFFASLYNIIQKIKLVWTFITNHKTPEHLEQAVLDNDLFANGCPGN